jgi:hypothetical protein
MNNVLYIFQEDQKHFLHQNYFYILKFPKKVLKFFGVTMTRRVVR